MNADKPKLRATRTSTLKWLAPGDDLLIKIGNEGLQVIFPNFSWDKISMARPYNLEDMVVFDVEVLFGDRPLSLLKIMTPPGDDSSKKQAIDCAEEYIQALYNFLCCRKGWDQSPHSFKSSLVAEKHGIAVEGGQ